MRNSIYEIELSLVYSRVKSINGAFIYHVEPILYTIPVIELYLSIKNHQMFKLLIIFILDSQDKDSDFGVYRYDY